MVFRIIIKFTCMINCRQIYCIHVYTSESLESLWMEATLHISIGHNKLTNCAEWACIVERSNPFLFNFLFFFLFLSLPLPSIWNFYSSAQSHSANSLLCLSFSFLSVLSDKKKRKCIHYSWSWASFHFFHCTAWHIISLSYVVVYTSFKLFWTARFPIRFCTLPFIDR